MNLFNATTFLKSALSIQNDEDFNTCALQLFKYQSEHVAVYKKFLQLLGKNVTSVHHYSEIPSLPVTLFKNFEITDQIKTPDFYFSSSGTTGQITSKHFISDKTVYEASLIKGFEYFYGSPAQYVIYALLPSYLERPGSSLVYMAEMLIKESGSNEGGFFLYNYETLSNALKKCDRDGEKIFLIGVTYALIDLFENFPMQLKNAIILETGGMKGKRKEIIRPELHKILSANSGIKNIQSEYGMTELLSQAYALTDGIFKTPPWMKIMIRDLHDPFFEIATTQTGIINVIDLANIHSCAFLETQDIGRKSSLGGFEVLGRMDSSELRGCNLMVY